MKAQTNCIFFVLILMTLSSCDYYIINPHKEDVGFIDEGEAVDDGFEVCFEEKIFPYYYGRQPAEFSFGKDSLKRYFTEAYKNFGDVSDSGYITFRFVINCKGASGRYVIHEVGTDYKPKEFNEKIVDNLFHKLKELKEWSPIKFYDDTYDSFIHITFKIENGELLEILP